MGRAGPILSTLGALAAASFLSAANARDAAAADPVPARINYYYAENWLCRPGREDACDVKLTATIVRPDGKLGYRRFKSDPHAPIDCFYVYPTVSRETTPLSDMAAGSSEREIARQQFAPFGSTCRLFAPLYRQATPAGFAAAARGEVPDFDPLVPARDVINAWNTYLADDNAGRGFVLIGHSQGAAILKNIVAALIDHTPLQRQLVSVIIPGTNVDVLPDQVAGGTFAGIPLCQAPDETGCVIVYSSFLTSNPPGADAAFGMSARPGLRDGCVNPATLATGGLALDAVLPSRLDGLKTRFRTPFFELPGLLTALCTSTGKYTYLAVSIGQDARTPEADRYLRYVDRKSGWGLHDMDMSLALGDLVTLVGIESKTWLAEYGPVMGARLPSR